MLDLQYDVIFKFFRAVHLDLLNKFTEGSSLNIKSMKEYLRHRDLKEWANLLERQYGEATEKKFEGGEVEFKGIKAEIQKKIDKHAEDQHKIDALPDLDEIYALDKEFSKLNEEKEGGSAEKEGKGLPVVDKAPLGSGENGKSPPLKRENSKLYLVSDRPLCDKRTIFHIREDYIKLQRLYMKLEEERELNMLTMKKLEEARESKEEEKRKRPAKRTKKSQLGLKRRSSILMVKQRQNIAKYNKKNPRGQQEHEKRKEAENEWSRHREYVKKHRETLATRTKEIHRNIFIQNTMLLLITIV